MPDVAWISAGIAGLLALLGIIGSIGVRALKRSLDESTIAALERNNKAIGEERDAERRHREALESTVRELQAQLKEQGNVVEVLRSAVQGRDDIEALRQLAVTQHGETMECLGGFRADWNHTSADVVAALTDIKGKVGLTARKGDPDGENSAGA